jgi:hypothetical protein
MSNSHSIAGLCFLLSFLLLSQKAVSQEESISMQVNAKLWNASGDTIYGKLQYINEFNLQFNVTLVDSAGHPLQLYSPKDLDGFIYYLDNDSVEYTSMDNPTDLGRLFLRLLYNGKLKMYQFLEINLRSSYLSYNVSYYLWDNEWLYPPITMKFEKESLLFHFSNCPDLKYKINSGIYHLSNIREILSEYEHCELTDKYEYFYE